MPVLRRTSLGSRLFVGSHGGDGRWDNDYGRDDHSKKERDSVPTGQTKRQEIGKNKGSGGKDYFLSLACCIGEYGANQLRKHVTIKVRIIGRMKKELVFRQRFNLREEQYFNIQLISLAFSLFSLAPIVSRQNSPCSAQSSSLHPFTTSSKDHK